MYPITYMLYKIAHNTLVFGEGQLPFVRLVHDFPDEAHLNSDLVLEGYFNDIYKLFLRKLVDFEFSPKIESAKTETLKSLLIELIRVKEFLVSGRNGAGIDALNMDTPTKAAETGNPFPKQDKHQNPQENTSLDSELGGSR